MAMKPLSFLLIIASLLASSSASVFPWGGRKALVVEAPAPAPTADDAFVTLDTEGDDVIDLARFAVNEYNKEHEAKLGFGRVISAAYTDTSKGVLFGFVIEAGDGTGVHAYDANVLVNSEAKKLVAFWKNEFSL